LSKDSGDARNARLYRIVLAEGLLEKRHDLVAFRARHGHVAPLNQVQCGIGTHDVPHVTGE